MSIILLLSCSVLNPDAYDHVLRRRKKTDIVVRDQKKAQTSHSQTEKPKVSPEACNTSIKNMFVIPFFFFRKMVY